MTEEVESSSSNDVSANPQQPQEGSEEEIV
jgi:hypothetical protein